MSKYAPFGDFLDRQKNDQVQLSFDQVEKVLGFRLPQSAYSQRAWWSNNSDNNVMTKVWRRAHFLTKSVDMEKRVIVFARQKLKPSEPPMSKEQILEQNARLKAMLKKNSPHVAEPARVYSAGHPLRGALKGHLRLVGGTDLTTPADPHWGDT